MNIPAEIHRFFVEQDLPLGEKSQLKNVSGGCINTCFELRIQEQQFFLKVNRSADYPGMFDAEYKGLSLLRASRTFTVPEPLLAVVSGNSQYLLMRFIERGQPGEDYFFSAGRLLAQLHCHHAEKFGLDHDNYIGSLKQANAYHESFSEFFICTRIEPMLKMAIDSGRAEQSITRSFNNFFSRLSELVPFEKPSLLHGDLWSGNMMCSDRGPAVFDPAVYYGHREADLAMTKLFGGFDEEFYEGYESVFPLEKNWRERTDLFNLYPLLVHVNLFGGGYLQEVKNIIRKF